MASSRTSDCLTELQRDLLRAFFQHEKRFFLTGGAALAGFHLCHRETHDLDLFTTEDILDIGDDALAAAAKQLGATVESIRTSPVMRRRIVHRADESVVVDLVHDQVKQGEPVSNCVLLLDKTGCRVNLSAKYVTRRSLTRELELGGTVLGSRIVR